MTQPDQDRNEACAADVIDFCTGLKATDALYALRRQRPKIVDATQASYHAMFAPEVEGISVTERLLIALYACTLSDAKRLASHYRTLLEQAKAPEALIAAAESHQTPTPALNAEPRLKALLSFTAKLILKPIEGDQKAIQSLVDAQLPPTAIVAVGQLIAFLSYQIRLVAGLKAMQSSPAVPQDGTSANKEPVSGALVANPIQIKGFTNEVLDWRSWVEPVALAHATQEQLSALEAMNPNAKNQDYFLMLAHQPKMLLERSIAFNAIMFAPGGMPRAERELAATVESRLNGCVYCASVHAQRFEQLAKRNDLIVQVFEAPETAGKTKRERAIVALSSAVSLTPQNLTAEDITHAKEAGLTETEILDLIHVVALFAWANRLMLNMGEPIHLDGTLAEKAHI